MNVYHLSLSIDYHEFLQDLVSAKSIRVHSYGGKIIHITPSVFRRFMNQNGVNGYYRVVMVENTIWPIEIDEIDKKTYLSEPSLDFKKPLKPSNATKDNINIH